MNLSRLTVTIGADISELQSKMKQVSRTVKDAGKSISNVGSRLSMGLSAPLAALGGVALKQAANFETLQQSMNALNGSVAEGSRQFERLKEFSATTPFQLNDLASAQNMLQGFGLSADEAFESLGMIGDISAISGGSIEGIGVAFGQAAAEGRLMTRDIRQLINQGVPAIQLLANTMGVAESEVLSLAENGEISFEILQQSFRDATSEGGLFANGMKRQSRTIAGLFSTLKDNVSIALGELGQTIVDTFNLREAIPNLIEKIQQAIDWFSKLSDDSRKNIILITTAIAGIGPALVAVGVTVTALGALFGALTSPIALVVGAIAGISIAITYVWDNFEAFKERFSDITWWRNAIVTMAQFLIDYNPLQILIKSFNALLGFLNMGEIPNPLTYLSGELEKLKGETREYKTQFGSLTRAMKNGFAELTGFDLGSIFSVDGGGIGNMAKGIKKATIPVKEFGRNLSELYVNVPKVRKSLNEFTDSAVEMGQALQSQVTSAVQSFATTLGNIFTGDAGAEGFFNNILLIVADFSANLGKALVAAGVAAIAFQQLLLNPYAAVAAGAALIATSQVVKNLLKEGPTQKVNDALITSSGKVIEFHPDDNILAMKDFSGLQTGGGGKNMNVTVTGMLRGEDIYVSGERGGINWNR